jgi:hypothetical protein
VLPARAATNRSKHRDRVEIDGRERRRDRGDDDRPEKVTAFIFLRALSFFAAPARLLCERTRGRPRAPPVAQRLLIC